MFKANNVQVKDAGSMEPPVDREELKHEAIEAEFDSLISDAGAIETAFAEGFALDAIACELFAGLANTHRASVYPYVATRVESALRRAIWEMAKANVEGRE